MVAISTACGAGNFSDPMACCMPGIERSSSSSVPPITSTDTSTPMIRPICCLYGVAPTRKPVFRSCDVAPALAEAIHTTEPTISATV